MNKAGQAYLKKIAHSVPAIYQIGKFGINENFVGQINDALEARELIKVSVLDTSMLSVKDAAYEVAKSCEAEVVQVIGRKFVLYKESKESKSIILP